MLRKYLLAKPRTLIEVTGGPKTSWLLISQYSCVMLVSLQPSGNSHRCTVLTQMLVQVVRLQQKSSRQM